MFDESLTRPKNLRKSEMLSGVRAHLIVGMTSFKRKLIAFSSKNPMATKVSAKATCQVAGILLEAAVKLSRVLKACAPFHT